MKSARKFWLVLLLSGKVCMSAEPVMVDVRTKPGQKWASYPTRTLATMQDFNPGTPIQLSKYGGRLDRKEKATGYFHTAKVDGRWWLVDPEGCLFISAGINTVSPITKADNGGGENADITENSGEGGNTVRVEKGDQGIGATAELLRTNGFNTLGCWSAGETFRKSPTPFPYCPRWNYMLSYRALRSKYYPGKASADIVYAFDPEFEKFCEEHSKQLDTTKNDPWLFGHFIDNELNFTEEGVVKRYLKLPVDDPCHQAAAKFMVSRKREKPQLGDDRAFIELVVGEYYRKVVTALKKHDPNHMCLGSRFHGKVLHSQYVFKGAGPYTDIISVNYYHSWGPTKDHPLDEWAKLSGKPILITEWYARTGGKGGAGWYVKTEADRGKFYQHMALGLLENPSCVGWHWFKYSMMFVDNQPSGDLFSACKAVNTQLYQLADFLGKRGEPPSTPKSDSSLVFGGQKWYRKSDPTFGPGPNAWAPDQTWVDEKGCLHLKIDRNASNAWRCAEVISEKSFGYGEYHFTFSGPLNGLAPNIVLGLFTYLDDAHEMDFELSRWGQGADPNNAQFVVQPAEASRMLRFATGDERRLTCRLVWTADRVQWCCWAGTGKPGTKPLAEWTFNGPGIPAAAQEKVHINLWLMKGQPPSDGRTAEVVVESFEFRAAPNESGTKPSTPDLRRETGR